MKKKVGYLSVNIKTKPIVIPQVLTNSMVIDNNVNGQNINKNNSNKINIPI
jgi:hypothetical protein